MTIEWCEPCPGHDPDVTVQAACEVPTRLLEALDGRAMVEKVLVRNALVLREYSGSLVLHASPPYDFGRSRTVVAAAPALES